MPLEGRRRQMVEQSREIIMNRPELDAEIPDLIKELQSAQSGTEVQTLELSSKVFPAPTFHEVLIFVGEGIEIAIIEIVLKEGIKRATNSVIKKLHEPIVITIFGRNGINEGIEENSALGLCLINGFMG
jgi:hypothetical protein